jgi:hypothetical protein
MQQMVDDDLFKLGRRKISVLALKDNILESHPQVAIQIHNTANEMMAFVYARMILVNQSTGARSSSILFPIAATFGLRPEKESPCS